MFQTFAENEDKNINECCICYSEEGNKLIECCPNKHLLCVKCFHESYKRNCECPLCCDLMYRPEIMTNDEDIAYYNAKVAKLELKYKKEREELRQNQLVQAKMRKQRQDQLERLQVRKTEQIQIIQSQNDELMRQISINNAKIENINKLELDEYNAIYPEPREILPVPPVSTTPVSTTPVSTTPVSTTPVSTTPVSTTPVSEPPNKKVKVSRIRISGKNYLKTIDNVLYDPDTRDEVGLWDPDTKTIKPLPEEDEYDYTEEDEYDYTEEEFWVEAKAEMDLLEKLKIPQLKEILKTFNFTKFSKLNKTDLVLKICDFKAKEIENRVIETKKRNREPSPVPIQEPSLVPIQEPSPVPIQEPSLVPIQEPSPVPIQEPSPVPIQEPSLVPIQEPSPVPIQEPSPVPIQEPSPVPVLTIEVSRLYIAGNYYLQTADKVLYDPVSMYEVGKWNSTLKAYNINKLQINKGKLDKNYKIINIKW